MKINYILSATAASIALLAPQSAEAGAETGAKPTSLSLSRETGCSVLTYRDCTGQTDALQLRTPSGTGDITFRVERSAESSDRIDISTRKVFASTGETEAHVETTAHLKGNFAVLDKSFKPSESTWINLGARLGKISGEGSLDGKASATLYPQTVIIPPGVMYGRFYPATTITTPRYDDKYAIAEDRKKSSLYGDLHETAAIDVAVSPRTRLAFSQSTQIGPINKVGLCGEVLLTSEAGTSRGLCRDSFLESSAKYAATIGLRVSDTKKDMLYERLRPEAERQAANLNNRLASEKNIPATVKVPTYNADDVLNFFGIEQPYRVSRSVVLGLSARFFDAASVSLTYIHPIQARANDKPSFNVAASYQFK